MAKRILINGKWPLILPKSSAEEWQNNMARHANTWEMPRLETLERIIKGFKDRKPIVMYIGAYKGDMAALLASWGADMILMESTPGYWPLIKETWKLNNLPEPLGFWSGLVGRETNLWDGSTGLPGLDHWPTRSEEYIEGTTGFTHLAESYDNPTFPRITIDNFIEITGLMPDIITMDVEGSELLVMQGGIDTLIKHNAKYMMSLHFEFGYHNHGYYMRELFDLFADNGYSWDYIDFDHEFHFLFYRKQNKGLT